MNKIFSVTLALLVTLNVSAQPTFKAGWNTYKTGWIVHEYTYNYSFKDSVKLYLIDSVVILMTPDSMVSLTVNTPLHEKDLYKAVNYFNAKKQVIKSEEYKGDNLQRSEEWKYDDKNRKIYHYEDNRVNGNNYKKNYQYETDKKNGDFIVTESSYFNGRIEFYTKSYYDRNSVKYKEVRLNDNNKDVVHIESYTYGENGKVKERSVYFPEWKVTRKFQEQEGNQLPKCYRTLPLGTTEKINLHARVTFLKKFLARVQPLLSDKDCDEFEYKFSNNSTYEIVVKSTKVNNIKQLVFRYKEKVQ